MPGSEAGRQETRGVAPLRGGGREQASRAGRAIRGSGWLCRRYPCAAAIRLDGHLSGDADSGNKGGEHAGPDRVKGAHFIATRPPLRCLSPPLLQECGGGGTPLGRRGEEIY